MQAIRVIEPGGPEKLSLSEVDKPLPGSGQALIRIAAAGVNFIDVYHRTGLYKLPLPLTPGIEGAGTVEEIGDGVTSVKVGDAVCYVGGSGSYAEYTVVPASVLVPVPAELETPQAAACMLQGMTAHYLCHSTYPLKPGETCLIHAAAGGTGALLVQMAKMLGARVLATTSTPQKAEVAKQAGADEVILYTEQDFDTEVRRLTGNRGVDVVYDSVGKSTFERSLNSLRPRGMMVSFGNASGAVESFQPLILSQKGSLFLTRPKLADYSADPDEMKWRAGDVLQWASSGKLKIHIGHTYSLAEAPQAHRDLESRKTMGKLLLLP